MNVDIMMLMIITQIIYINMCVCVCVWSINWNDVTIIHFWLFFKHYQDWRSTWIEKISSLCSPELNEIIFLFVLLEFLLDIRSWKRSSHSFLFIKILRCFFSLSYIWWFHSFLFRSICNHFCILIRINVISNGFSLRRHH